MTDPTAIDLEVIRARSAPTVHAPGAYDINRLIAAVEALRERVFLARTEVTRLQTANAHWHLRVSQMKTDAEAVEAHTTELAGALAWFDTHASSLASDLHSAHALRGDTASEFMRKDDRELRKDFYEATNRARTTLASTPAQALERARARDEVVRVSRSYCAAVPAWDAGYIREALAKLDALTPEDGT